MVKHRLGVRAAARSRWVKVLAEFAGSGMSGRRFCAERGLSYSTFNYRRRRQGKESAPTGFRELMAPAATGSGIVVQIHGVAIEVQRGFDAATLRAVVASLR